MSELIDKQAVLKVIRENSFIGLGEKEALLDAIKGMHAIEERKKGTWIWGDGIRCSNCNYKLQTTGLPSCCPNCFAEMCFTEIEE